jgi:D-arabinose 1-dehydrogenase-like Zn-dependent alcohol dehydrogenase
MSLPKTYKHAVFKEKGAPLTLEETELRMPSENEILIKVEACGVCYSDMYAQYNGMGGGFPLVPGHEVIGRVAAVGSSVIGWKSGDRIGTGWHGGHDGTCNACKQGWYQMCDNPIVNGENKNGGCESPLPSAPI